MKCLFCDQLIDKTLPLFRETIIYRCIPCDVDYYQHKDTKMLTSYSFNYKEYRLNFFYKKRDNSMFTLTKIRSMLVGFDIILSLPTWPNITPKNAKDKINLLLVFS